MTLYFKYVLMSVGLHYKILLSLVTGGWKREWVDKVKENFSLTNSTYVTYMIYSYYYIRRMAKTKLSISSQNFSFI